MNESRLPPNSNEGEPPDIVDAALAALAADELAGDPPPELLATTLVAISAASNPANNNVVNATRTDQSTENPFPTSLSPNSLFRSRLMKAFSTTLGVLASTALVFVAAALLQNPASAFAEVMAKIRSAKMVSYHRLLIVEDNPEGISIREYETSDGRRRSEQGLSITVFRPDHFIDFSFTKGMNVVRYPSKDRPVRNDGTQRNFIQNLQDLQQRTKVPDKVLDNQMIEGREAVGFVVTDETDSSSNRYTLWITPDTNELVKLVRETSYKGRESTTVYTGFEFFEEIDESLFTVPDSYKEYEKPTVPFAERQTGSALRAFARHNDGVFPDSLTDMSIWLDKFQASETGGFGNRDSNSAIKAICQTIDLLSRTAPKDFGYLGVGRSMDAGETEENSASVESTETMIFWYRNKEGVARAIFDDLSARVVSDEEIAAAEADWVALQE